MNPMCSNPNKQAHNAIKYIGIVRLLFGKMIKIEATNVNFQNWPSNYQPNPHEGNTLRAISIMSFGTTISLMACQY